MRIFELRGSASILEYQTTHKVATKTISYGSYGEILFQKVASGCLLPFVQDGSSKKRIIKIVFPQTCQKSKILFFFIFSSPPHSYRLKAGPMYSPPNSRSTAPLRRLFMLFFPSLTPIPKGDHVTRQCTCTCEGTSKSNMQAHACNAGDRSMRLSYIGPSIC